LHSAAASTENSWLKYAPIRVRRGRGQLDLRRHAVLHQLVVVLEGRQQVVVPAREAGQHVVEQPGGLRLVELQDALDQAGGPVLHHLGVFAGHEQLDHHAPVVRLHDDVVPGDEGL
jgi:hypothetical protein